MGDEAKRTREALTYLSSELHDEWIRISQALHHWDKGKGLIYGPNGRTCPANGIRMKIKKGENLRQL